MIATSPDGGSSWRTKQVTPAQTGGHGVTEFGLSGCTVRTDSHGVVYVFAEMFQNPLRPPAFVDAALGRVPAGPAVSGPAKAARWWTCQLAILPAPGHCEPTNLASRSPIRIRRE
jgi:hypothetical protein